MPVEGLHELMKAFDEIADINKDPEISDALMDEASDLQRRVIERAPLGKTGNLRRGVVYKPLLRGKTKPMALVAMDNRIAPHAHLVEFGTVHAGPHPFFRPALDEFEPQFGKHLIPVLKRRIDSRWK